MPPSVQLVLIVAVLAGFWLIAIRPARRRQQEVDSFQSRLEVGQHVVLSAGIFGRVVALRESRVELEIAPGTVITVARQVVLREATLGDAEDRGDHDGESAETPRPHQTETGEPGDPGASRPQD